MRREVQMLRIVKGCLDMSDLIQDLRTESSDPLIQRSSHLADRILQGIVILRLDQIHDGFRA